MHHVDGFMHTDTEGLHISTWEDAEVGILFGIEHQLQMGGSFWGMEGAPILTQCSLFLPGATRLEGEVAALNPEGLCFFWKFSSWAFFFNAFNYHSSNYYIPSTSTQELQKFGISCTN